MRKRIRAGLTILLCTVLLWTGGVQRAAAASKGGTQTTTLSGTVETLKRDGDNYVVQVTVANSGEDFAGTVQVIFAGNSYDNCAYNTDITLPAQGKKQFTITVPGQTLEKARGLCALRFLDRKGLVIRSIELKNVLGDAMTGVKVGILSDNYQSLTYLDAGGRDFSIKGNINLPLQLIELNQENLRENLDGLYFLVIDRFNVSSLSDEDIQAIREWTEKGGWLMVGTGAWAEQTLSGFPEDFLDLEVLDISEPGEENIVSTEMNMYGNYYYFMDANVDFKEMAIASLASRQHAYIESRENPSLYGEYGDGAVVVFFFSLGEEELQRLDDYIVENLYHEVMYCSRSFTSLAQSDDMDYVGQRALAYMDNRETNVDFTWLKILIGVYVVLAGPVLYLILRKCKKSEWYWIGVPVTGLLFIAGVFFFGKDARVREPKVYSITVQQADGSRKNTYFLAYQAGVKPWEIRLNDSYDVAGPGFTGHNYWNYSANVSDYLFMVRNDGDRLWIGLKPEDNFQNGFLYAGGRTESKGQLTGSVDILQDGSMDGTIRNETACDLRYMAVMHDSGVIVFSNVKAGETIDIKEEARNSRYVYENYQISYYGNLFNSMVTGYWTQTELSYDRKDMAALLIGLGTAQRSSSRAENKAVVVGLIDEYNQAAAENCKELSYGCIYSWVDAR